MVCDGTRDSRDPKDSKAAREQFRDEWANPKRAGWQLAVVACNPTSRDAVIDGEDDNTSDYALTRRQICRMRPGGRRSQSIDPIYAGSGWQSMAKKTESMQQAVNRRQDALQQRRGVEEKGKGKGKGECWGKGLEDEICNNQTPAKRNNAVLMRTVTNSAKASRPALRPRRRDLLGWLLAGWHDRSPFTAACNLPKPTKRARPDSRVVRRLSPPG